MCQYNPLENGCYHNNAQHVCTSKYTLTLNDDRTEAKILNFYENGELCKRGGIILL